MLCGNYFLLYSVLLPLLYAADFFFNGDSSRRIEVVLTTEKKSLCRLEAVPS